MKKGQTVSVYQKPLTKEDYEGDAKLVKLMDYGYPPDGYEYWEVKFISDGRKTIRLIEICEN